MLAFGAQLNTDVWVPRSATKAMTVLFWINTAVFAVGYVGTLFLFRWGYLVRRGVTEGTVEALTAEVCRVCALVSAFVRGV